MTAAPIGDDAPTRPLGILPGWYGKMPQLGDFASRRLDDPFPARWDAWLQQCLSSARNALGDVAFTEAYVRAPAWHFLLMPGVIDGAAWAGVLMASVDRVGRHFPLTACMQTRDPRAVLASLAEGGVWHQRVSQALLSAVSGEVDVDGFEQLLATCLFPLNRHLPNGAGRELLSAAAVSLTGRIGAVTLPGPLDQALPAAGLDLLARDLTGESLWWTSPADGATTLLIARGLPAPGDYLALLQPPG